MARARESTSTEATEPEEARLARLLAGRTIVMVGMMGAGKSSIGRRLAARLGRPGAAADR
jgi:shikimate kinase